MSTEWLNAVEALRKIGLTKVCIVVALTILGLLVAGDWLGKRAPGLNDLWAGWAPSILVGTVAWVAVSILEAGSSALAKRVAAFHNSGAEQRRAVADARDLEERRQARAEATRAAFHGLSEPELLVLRSFIEKSSRRLDWNITRVHEKNRIMAAIDSLIARRIVNFDHWLDEELYEYLLEHPEVVGSTMQPRKVWRG